MDCKADFLALTFMQAQVPWFVPRFLEGGGGFMRSHALSSVPEYCYAQIVRDLTYLHGDQENGALDALVAVVTGREQGRRVLAVAAKRLLLAGAAECTRTGSLGKSLYELSDGAQRGLLGSVEQRVVICGAGYSHVASSEDIYRVYEVSLCGVVANIQRDFLLSWLNAHLPSAWGDRPFAEVMGMVEGVITNQHYRFHLQHFIAYSSVRSENSTPPSSAPADSSKGMPASFATKSTTKAYTDVVYNEIVALINHLERAEAREDGVKTNMSQTDHKSALENAKSSPSSTTPDTPNMLGPFSIVKFCAALIVASRVGDEKGMQVILELFAMWCSEEVLFQLPGDVLKLVMLLACNDEWKSRTSGFAISTAANALLSRIGAESTTHLAEQSSPQPAEELARPRLPTGRVRSPSTAEGERSATSSLDVKKAPRLQIASVVDPGQKCAKLPCRKFGFVPSDGAKREGRPLILCESCGETAYCSRLCQVQDHKHHHPSCRPQKKD